MRGYTITARHPSHPIPLRIRTFDAATVERLLIMLPPMGFRDVVSAPDGGFPSAEPA